MSNRKRETPKKEPIECKAAIEQEALHCEEVATLTIETDVSVTFKDKKDD